MVLYRSSLNNASVTFVALKFPEGGICQKVSENFATLTQQMANEIDYFVCFVF